VVKNLWSANVYSIQSASTNPDLSFFLSFFFFWGGGGRGCGGGGGGGGGVGLLPLDDNKAIVIKLCFIVRKKSSRYLSGINGMDKLVHKVYVRIRRRLHDSSKIMS
jgi:hypothetical protein